MKCLSICGDKWVERLAVKISEQEKSILSDPSEERWDERKRLVKTIQERSLKIASKEDGEKAKAAYDSHKIKGSETISANIILPGLHGSINCKVDGQYKQIRF